MGMDKRMTSSFPNELTQQLMMPTTEMEERRKGENLGEESWWVQFRFYLLSVQTLVLQASYVSQKAAEFARMNTHTH